MVAWIYLALAGAAEIAWVISLKQADGFTRLWPTVAVVVLAFLSFGLLGLSLRGVPLGTAYAIWAGIGTVGAAVIGIVWYGEAATATRLVLLALIAVGIVGLKLVEPQ